jgi:plasma kallikrein
MDNDGAGIFNIRSNLDRNFLPCESLRKCCEIDNIKEEIPQFEIPKSCGYRNADGLGYYSFGKQKESQYGEFPWVTATLKRIKFGSSVTTLYMSAGSLIHPSIVLSTAHNLNNTNVNDLLIRAGEWNTQSTDEMFKHQERDVQSVTYHRDFKRINLHNDISIIFLEKPFKLAPHINTICLPQSSYEYSGEKCFASGWGKDEVRK